MDLCHLKNWELEPQFQKYKGLIVLRGDIVKDDSGSFAVFTEQGSSASQMTATEVMDIISRLQGCWGQAADDQLGSPTHIYNKRRRGTREGPEPAYVCKHRSCPAWHTQERKGELTSCRGTVWPRVSKTSSETQRRQSRAARKGKWSPRGTVNRQAAPILEVRLGEQARLVKTVNIQVRWAAAHPGTRPSAPECGDTLKAPVGDWRPI